MTGGSAAETRIGATTYVPFDVWVAALRTLLAVGDLNRWTNVMNVGQTATICSFQLVE